MSGIDRRRQGRWGRRMLGVAIGVAAGLIVLVGVGWIAFVPSPSEAPYEFVSAWGEKGAGPGQFEDPTGIAVADGEVFVADSRNGRIQVFDLDGRFERMFGAPGDEPGELGRPMNITVRTGELYVPEYFNDRIQVFGLDGTPKRIIGGAGSGPGEFDAPVGVAVAPGGDLFVADFYGQRVQQLKPDGTFVRQWGTTGQTSHARGEFYYPTDVALDRAGHLYVADGYGHRIQVFDPSVSNGGHLRSWGGPFARGIYGPFRGWLSTVTAVAVGPEGDVFAADFYNDRIQKFASDGTFLTSFGETGSGAGQLHHPMGVAVAEDGSVFVTDFLNHRIQKWRPPGG